jgi:hypothetical protein
MPDAGKIAVASLGHGHEKTEKGKELLTP